MSTHEALIAELQRHRSEPSEDRYGLFKGYYCESALGTPPCSWMSQYDDQEVAAREHAEHVAQELVDHGLAVTTTEWAVQSKTFLAEDAPFDRLETHRRMMGPPHTEETARAEVAKSTGERSQFDETNMRVASRGTTDWREA